MQSAISNNVYFMFAFIPMYLTQKLAGLSALKWRKYLALKTCRTLHLLAWNEPTDKVKEVNLSALALGVCPITTLVRHSASQKLNTVTEFDL